MASSSASSTAEGLGGAFVAALRLAVEDGGAGEDFAAGGAAGAFTMALGEEEVESFATVGTGGCSTASKGAGGAGEDLAAGGAAGAFTVA